MNQLSRKLIGIHRRESIGRWSLSGLIGMVLWGTVTLISTAGAAAQHVADLENPACTQDAHVITVPGGDAAALIAAINAANSHSEGTLINLEAGVYTLTAVDNSIQPENNNGLPLIVSPICIQGAGAHTTIIERAAAADDFRLFYVTTGGILTLNAVTLQGGQLWEDGGGLFNDHDGRVIISHSVITRCHVIISGGAGIFNRGTMRITQSTLSHNSQGDGGGGGGLYNEAEMTISQSTIAGNWVNEAGGGGIENHGNLTITQSTIANNRGDFYGGGIENHGNLTITQSTIANNRVSGFGSIAALGGGIFNSGELHIIQSTLSGNQAFEHRNRGPGLLGGPHLGGP